MRRFAKSTENSLRTACERLAKICKIGEIGTMTQHARFLLLMLCKRLLLPALFLACISAGSALAQDKSAAAISAPEAAAATKRLDKLEQHVNNQELLNIRRLESVESRMETMDNNVNRVLLIFGLLLVLVLAMLVNYQRLAGRMAEERIHKASEKAETLMRDIQRELTRPETEFLRIGYFLRRLMREFLEQQVLSADIAKVRVYGQDPNLPVSLHCIAHSLVAGYEERWKDAIEQLEQLRQMDRHDPFVLLHLSNAHAHFSRRHSVKKEQQYHSKMSSQYYAQYVMMAASAPGTPQTRGDPAKWRLDTTRPTAQRDAAPPSPVQVITAPAPAVDAIQKPASVSAPKAQRPDHLPSHQIVVAEKPKPMAKAPPLRSATPSSVLHAEAAPPPPAQVIAAPAVDAIQKPAAVSAPKVQRPDHSPSHQIVVAAKPKPMAKAPPLRSVTPSSVLHAEAKPSSDIAVSPPKSSTATDVISKSKPVAPAASASPKTQAAVRPTPRLAAQPQPVKSLAPVKPIISSQSESPASVNDAAVDGNDKLIRHQIGGVAEAPPINRAPSHQIVAAEESKPVAPAASASPKTQAAVQPIPRLAAQPQPVKSPSPIISSPAESPVPVNAKPVNGTVVNGSGKSFLHKIGKAVSRNADVAIRTPIGILKGLRANRIAEPLPVFTLPDLSTIPESAPVAELKMWQHIRKGDNHMIAAGGETSLRRRNKRIDAALQSYTEAQTHKTNLTLYLNWGMALQGKAMHVPSPKRDLYFNAAVDKFMAGNVIAPHRFDLAIASLYAALGAADECHQWLQQLSENGQLDKSLLHTAPEFDNMRNQSWFADFLQDG